MKAIYWLSGLTTLCAFTVQLTGAEPTFIASLNLQQAKALEGSPAHLESGFHERDLTISAEIPKESIIKIGEIANPKIRERIFAIRGQISYNNLGGDGYLEMWTQIRGKRFFSRSLAEEGKFRKLTGTSKTREFIVPFNLLGATGPVEKVELNLVLPKGGIVFLGDVTLVEYQTDNLAEILMEPGHGAWWSDRQGGWAGAIAGVVLGMLGALTGMLSKHRPIAGIWVSVAVSALGLGILTAGVWAILLRQPYGVWFPLLLAGVLSTTIFGPNAWLLMRNQRGLELRRMAALDAAS